MFNTQDYDNKLLAEIERRSIMLQRCEEDKTLQQCLIQQCKDDILFYFKNFAWTNKNNVFIGEQLPYAIPFLPFDYQEELILAFWDCIVNKKSIFIEKSRQVGITWLIMGVFIYGVLFHGKKFHIISRTSDEVDSKGDINSCFGRLRFALELTPRFLLPEGFDKKEGGSNNKYMNICRLDMPSAITGESANPNAARGGTYDAIFLDEMAFMQDATAINRSASQATSCRIINSTPNGEYNEYFEMKKLVGEEKMLGYRLHWTVHPFYTEEWYKWKTKDMTDEQIQQELEINYNLSIEGRVYRRFEPKPIGDIDIGVQYEYNYINPLYLSLDNSHGGQDPHAAVLFQIDLNGNIVFIDAIQMNCSVTQMASFLARTPTHKLSNYELDFFDRYAQYKTPIFIADPNDTSSTMNDTSIYNEYRKVGIHLNTPMIQRGAQGNIVEQIRITTSMISRMRVNPRCKDFISAIQNARYPKREPGSNSTSENKRPVHDQTSHYRTAMEYACLWVYENEKGGRMLNGVKPQKIRKKIMVADMITGELKEKFIEV